MRNPWTWSWFQFKSGRRATIAPAEATTGLHRPWRSAILKTPGLGPGSPRPLRAGGRHAGRSPASRRAGSRVTRLFGGELRPLARGPRPAAVPIWRIWRELHRRRASMRHRSVLAIFTACGPVRVEVSQPRQPCAEPRPPLAAARSARTCSPHRTQRVVPARAATGNDRGGPADRTRSAPAPGLEHCPRQRGHASAPRTPRRGRGACRPSRRFRPDGAPASSRTGE